MSAALKRLLDERAKAWAAAEDIRARLEKDDHDPTKDSEDTAAYNKALDEVQAYSESIEELERGGRMDAALNAVPPAPAPVAGAVAGADDETAYAEAFAGYLRHGINGVAAEHRAELVARANPLGIKAAQGTTPGSAGGFLIPTDTLRTLTEVMKAFGGILGVANVINTASGNPLNWPTNDDTGNTGAILTEGSQVTELALTFGQKTLGAHTYTSRLILVAWQLLQDEVFGLEGYVTRKAGERIGRAVSAHLATGTGTGQPEGLFTNATVGKTGAAGQVTSVLYDDLVDLIHSVDPAYRDNGGRWVLSDQALKMVRKLKDTTGQPLWQPSVIAGEPSTILGFPYTIDQGVAVPAASARSIGFGNVAAAYVVRQVAGGQMVRLEERYADFLQTGFFAFLRLDAKPDDTTAFKVYAHPAA